MDGSDVYACGRDDSEYIVVKMDTAGTFEWTMQLYYSPPTYVFYTQTTSYLHTWANIGTSSFSLFRIPKDGTTSGDHVSFSEYDPDFYLY